MSIEGRLRGEAGRQAGALLREELGERHVDLALLAESVPAAEELCRFPREAWAPPRDAWEQLVVCVAMTLTRLRGRFPPHHAIAGLREALADLAQEAAA